MTEAFLPWLDKLQKLYKSRTYDGRDDSYTDSKGDQEWIQKTKERIEQKKSYEKLNKDLYKCVSAVSVNNLASNKLRFGSYSPIY